MVKPLQDAVSPFGQSFKDCSHGAGNGVSSVGVFVDFVVYVELGALHVAFCHAFEVVDLFLWKVNAV